PNPNVDPIGACVGDRSERINSIIAELNGEKIDIIEYSEDLATFVARSLSPAPVENVQIISEGRTLAVVPDDKLSLAIGKSGQNVRLAARLAHTKIDVKSHSAYEHDYLAEQTKTQVNEAELTNLDDMFSDAE
ncbi:MAG TPA: transcription termination/antitermination protein NusA, partial [Clostridiales bacterium]|nr:transcription termination/antitermination protein NusA [Clostridiales bacterium]